MKFYYPSFFLLSLLPALALGLSSSQSNDRVLSSTPKARDLRDHFGVSKSREMYGPPPSLNLDTMLIKNADGSWTKIPDPALANEIVTPDGKKCDITQHSYYQICYAAENCQQCSAIESCGWCESNKKCLPGNIDGCFCKGDCPADWLESPIQCKDPEHNYWGEMTNISPRASKFIKAQLTGPKLNVTTTEVRPGWENVPMNVGNVVTRKNVTVFNAGENRIATGEVNLDETVVRDVPLPSLEIKRETRTYDLATGKEIPQNNNVTLHGVDPVKK